MHKLVNVHQPASSWSAATFRSPKLYPPPERLSLHTRSCTADAAVAIGAGVFQFTASPVADVPLILFTK